MPAWPERGQFGDMFGGLNALFAALAFAGVIYAIILQRRELALQREELKLTREELTRAADAQEESKQALIEQVGQLRRSAKIAAIGAMLEAYGKVVQTQESLGRKRSFYPDGIDAEVDRLTNILYKELEDL